MAKLALSQLEQATTVPDGSLHLVEMGDGSGTKTVTQETMVEETGKALKIGNMEELQTENKTSIVSAINEVKQSGGSGGTSVDILDSQEEIEANTEAGKAAGALAVQEMFGALNDKLKGFEPVIDETTGQLTGYKTTVGGADTVFPFIKSNSIIINIRSESPQNVFYYGEINFLNYESGVYTATQNIALTISLGTSGTRNSSGVSGDGKATMFVNDITYASISAKGANVWTANKYQITLNKGDTLSFSRSGGNMYFVIEPFNN